MAESNFDRRRDSDREVRRIIIDITEGTRNKNGWLSATKWIVLAIPCP